MRTSAGKFVFVIFILFALLFVGVGGWMAWSQQYKLATYRPVPAQILASSVEFHSSGKSQSYTPVVVFRYQVEGHTHEGRDLWPLKVSSSRSWAEALTSRYRAGDTATAYYDPQNPDAAFIERHCTFFPYVFVLFPMILVMAGVAGLCAQTKASQPTPETGGWFSLQATSNIAGRRRTALIVAGLWCGIGGMAIGHFLSLAERPYETLAVVAMSIYGALGLIPLGSVVYYVRLLQNIGDAVVSLDAAGVRIGAPFKVRVVQAIHENLQIQELAIGILCRETSRRSQGGKNQIATRDCYEDKLPVIGSNYARAGENVTATAQLQVPVEQPTSTPSGDTTYPRYEWFIAVKTKLAGSPDYRAKFPVTVSRD